MILFDSNVIILIKMKQLFWLLLPFHISAHESVWDCGQCACVFLAAFACRRLRMSECLFSFYSDCVSLKRIDALRQPALPNTGSLTGSPKTRRDHLPGELSRCVTSSVTILNRLSSQITGWITTRVMARIVHYHPLSSTCAQAKYCN